MEFVDRRRVLSWLSILIGVVVLGAGLIHSVAVTYVARESRQVFDQRNLTLLIVGLVPVLAGALLLLNARGIGRADSRADLNACLGAGAMFIVSIYGANFDGFWIGMVLMGGFIVAVVAVRRRERRAPIAIPSPN